jgi:predicted DsbA family dithiol-disulfide isomerase
VEIALYHDVLCSWCYVADQRLEVLRKEYGSAVKWTLKGFPLRPEDSVPDKKQRQVLARHFRRVAKEAEGQGVSADLWTGNDPPSSSMPPLIALEAALPQGEDKQRELLKALRRAAFVDGINIARRDVILELAAKAGLDVPRFLEKLDDSHTPRLVDESYQEADGHGIKGVPALVIGGEWLMQGAREIVEYRQVIDKYLAERVAGQRLRVLH